MICSDSTPDDQCYLNYYIQYWPSGQDMDTDHKGLLHFLLGALVNRVVTTGQNTPAALQAFNGHHCHCHRFLLTRTLSSLQQTLLTLHHFTSPDSPPFESQIKVLSIHDLGEAELMQWLQPIATQFKLKIVGRTSSLSTRPMVADSSILQLQLKMADRTSPCLLIPLCGLCLHWVLQPNLKW